MNEEIDAALDAVLKAGGSALRHYTMQKSLDDMREVMRRIVRDAYVTGYQAALEGSGKQALRRDAERYRWLRDPERATMSVENGEIPNRVFLVLDQLDAAIDEARSGKDGYCF